MPLITSAVTTGIAAGFSPTGQPSDEVLGFVVFPMIVPLIIGSVYNLKGFSHGRVTAYVGLGISIMSLVIWVGVILCAVMD